MLDEAEYASSTDESDDDYNPNADGSDVGSEVESDGEPENDNETETKSKKTKTAAKKRPAEEESPLAQKRTRQTEVTESKTTEKDTLPDDDEDDDNEEELWAKFMSNTGQTAAPAKPVQPTKSAATSSNGKSATVSKPAPKPQIDQKKTVTEIFEFAGERVEVQKQVKVSDEKPTSSDTNGKPAAKPGIASFNRRSGGGSGGGGLSSVLGQIGKKNKLSILEKTNLDWNGFKQAQGIDEELQTHNKGRDGYLERQDFLQRTDVRQFEIEKSMRQANRKK